MAAESKKQKEKPKDLQTSQIKQALTSKRILDIDSHEHPKTNSSRRKSRPNNRKHVLHCPYKKKHSPPATVSATSWPFPVAVLAQSLRLDSPVSFQKWTTSLILPGNVMSNNTWYVPVQVRVITLMVFRCFFAPRLTPQRTLSKLPGSSRCRYDLTKKIVHRLTEQRRKFGSAFSHLANGGRIRFCGVQGSYWALKRNATRAFSAKQIAWVKLRRFMVKSKNMQCSTSCQTVHRLVVHIPRKGSWHDGKLITWRSHLGFWGTALKLFLAAQPLPLPQLGPMVLQLALLCGLLKR